MNTSRCVSKSIRRRSARERRVIRRRFLEASRPQETTQRQRIGGPPRDATLRISTLEVTDQEQPEKRRSLAHRTDKSSNWRAMSSRTSFRMGSEASKDASGAPAVWTHLAQRAVQCGRNRALVRKISADVNLIPTGNVRLRVLHRDGLKGNQVEQPIVTNELRDSRADI